MTVVSEEKSVFQETAKLFEFYILKILDGKANVRYDKDRNLLIPDNLDLKYLASEIHKRINQLDFLIRKIFVLQATASRTVFHVGIIASTGLPPDMDYEAYKALNLEDATGRDSEAFKEDQRRFEIETLTESFYYIAFRIRQALRNEKVPFPGLGGFECVGVRDTRNKLIEHVERKDSKVFMPTFGYGDKGVGPQIKPLRSPNNESTFNDNGIYYNAKEFCENLDRLLFAAVGEAR